MITSFFRFNLTFGIVAEPHLCIWRADENKMVNSGNAEGVDWCWSVTTRMEI